MLVSSNTLSNDLMETKMQAEKIAILSMLHHFDHILLWRYSVSVISSRQNRHNKKYLKSETAHSVPFIVLVLDFFLLFSVHLGECRAALADRNGSKWMQCVDDFRLFSSAIAR